MDLASETRTRAAKGGAVDADLFDLFERPLSVESPREQRTPFVFSSPHSGRCYPDGFVSTSNLDPVTLRRSEDCFVEDLFGGVVALGAPLLHARFPRAFLDVNREP